MTVLSPVISETASRLGNCSSMCGLGVCALLRRVRHDWERAGGDLHETGEIMGGKLAAAANRRSAESRSGRDGYGFIRNSSIARCGGDSAPARTSTSHAKGDQGVFHRRGVPPEILSGSFVEGLGREAPKGPAIRSSKISFPTSLGRMSWRCPKPTSRRSCNSGLLNGKAVSRLNRLADLR